MEPQLTWPNQIFILVFLILIFICMGTRNPVPQTIIAFSKSIFIQTPTATMMHESKDGGILSQRYTFLNHSNDITLGNGNYTAIWQSNALCTRCTDLADWHAKMTLHGYYSIQLLRFGHIYGYARWYENTCNSYQCLPNVYRPLLH